MSIPGVHAPHCRPWHTENASCSGCSVPSGAARPSTVATDGAVGLHGEHQARAGGLAVDEDGARAAHPVLAPEVGAGEAEVLAQRVGEGAPGLDVEAVTLAVDRQGDPHAGSWAGTAVTAPGRRGR